jgi:hypothetical protein
MAHARPNCKNVSISYSAPPAISERIKSYRHKKQHDTQSEAITELILMGLKYKAIVEKKRARMSS